MKNVICKHLSLLSPPPPPLAALATKSAASDSRRVNLNLTRMVNAMTRSALLSRANTSAAMWQDYAPNIAEVKDPNYRNPRWGSPIFDLRGRRATRSTPPRGEASRDPRLARPYRELQIWDSPIRYRRGEDIFPIPTIMAHAHACTGR